MSRFKIICAGWRCDGWWERTVRSIEAQSLSNWDVGIVYDGGDDAGPKIQAWCDEHGPRWHFHQNETQRFAPYNQFHAIRNLHPADDDIVVFLDLDGDQLAHPNVLAHLAHAYADTTLVTYGNYRPVPDHGTCPAAKPYPPEVVKANGYRAWVRGGQECCFNHLRTMKGRVANALTAAQFQWPDGRWYEGPADYLFMIPALELAGGRYKCLTEVLDLYNNANPNADNLTHPGESTAGCMDMLSRPPLSPLR